ncbi:MAG TPA: hypothetical protein VLS96_06780, partial [Nodosilinea sp.]|nr:hypothetical protein [Nodosilinea sp.]
MPLFSPAAQPILPQRRWWPSLPLPWLLTAALVLPAVGAAALVGYLSYRGSERAVRLLGQQLMLDTNQQVVQELERYLSTPLVINRINVDGVRRGQLAVTDAAALEAKLVQRLQQFDGVAAVLFASPAGLLRQVERRPELHLVVADPPQPERRTVYRLGDDGQRQALVPAPPGPGGDPA